MIALLAAKFASTATPLTIQLFIEAHVHLRSTHRPGIDVSAALERCAQGCAVKAASWSSGGTKVAVGQTWSELGRQPHLTGLGFSLTLLVRVMMMMDPDMRHHHSHYTTSVLRRLQTVQPLQRLSDAVV